jgi:hypothetical protein
MAQCRGARHRSCSAAPCAAPAEESVKARLIILVAISALHAHLSERSIAKLSNVGCACVTL